MTITGSRLRVLLADDERSARRMLRQLLDEMEGVEVVGEAADGAEALALIEAQRPDLALLDLQMPEIDGLSLVRLIRKTWMPLVAFVTAYDEYAVQAFEVHAVDYLLKPVDRARLAATILHAQERLEHDAARSERETARQRTLAAADTYAQYQPPAPLVRIPVRRRDDIILLPVAQLASAVADGELLHLTTLRGERHTITYRLKDLEARLDPARFIRVERGALVNVDLITKVSPLPGGTYMIALSNGQELRASRIQSRVLRDQFLKL
jgi:two-component system, LytTR family, response regulator